MTQDIKIDAIDDQDADDHDCSKFSSGMLRGFRGFSVQSPYWQDLSFPRGGPYLQGNLFSCEKEGGWF